MQPIDYRLRLDTTRPGSQAQIYVKKDDVLTRRIVIQLVSGSAAYPIEEAAEVTLRGVKPDGTVVFASCEIENDLILHTITPQTMAVAGRVNCELNVYGNGGLVMTSPAFDIYVQGTLYGDDVIESSNEFSVLADAILAEQARQEAENQRETAENLRKHLYEDIKTSYESGLLTGPAGPAGPPGPQGERGLDGLRGPKGDTGDTGPAGPPGPQGERGVDGLRGPKGDTGDTGPQGPAGQDFSILGYYTTLSDLQSAVANPNPGDAYGIGFSAPFNIYIFDGNSRTWIDNGTIQGPPGARGEPGQPGPKGDTGPQGVRGEPGQTGPKGDTGPQGYTFTPHVDNYVVTWSNDGGLLNPDATDLKVPVEQHAEDTTLHTNASERKAWNEKADGVHDQAASTITAGTLAGKVNANVASMASEDAQVRDVVLTTTDPGAGSSTNYQDGTVILVYE